LRFAGQLHLQRGELDDAEAALEAAREHLAEAGAAWSLGRTLNFAAWTARHKGELTKAERLFRESIRILAPLEDRATLCETQRSLAELLLATGRVDERVSRSPPTDRRPATSARWPPPRCRGLVRATLGQDDGPSCCDRLTHGPSTGFA
jgi:tetratricopeptide (TPR) repeat protein